MQSGTHSTQRITPNNVIRDSAQHLNILQFINFRVLDLTTLILQRILKIAIDVIIYGLHTMIVRNQVKQTRRQKNGRFSFPEYHWQVYIKSVNILWSLNVHLTVSHYKLGRECCPHNVDFKNSCKDLERSKASLYTINPRQVLSHVAIFKQAFFPFTQSIHVQGILGAHFDSWLYSKESSVWGLWSCQ